MTDLNNELRKTNKQLENQIENYIKKLREVLFFVQETKTNPLHISQTRENDATLEEKFSNELMAKDKLITVLQTSHKNNEAKVKELDSACTEMKGLLDDSTEGWV